MVWGKNPKSCIHMYPVVSAPSVKKTMLFPIELLWDLCQKVIDSIYIKVSFTFWNQEVHILHFVFKLFRLRWVLCISMSILGSACQFLLKKTCWDFGRYCFESIDRFGRIAILMLNLPIHKHRMSLHLFWSSLISLNNVL